MKFSDTHTHTHKRLQKKGLAILVEDVSLILSTYIPTWGNSQLHITLFGGGNEGWVGEEGLDGTGGGKKEGSVVDR